jgi:hypothetical protein
MKSCTTNPTSVVQVIERHTSIAQSAYHDLLRALNDARFEGIRGTPTREARNGRLYWYDIYRIGDQVKKTYIGEDAPELAASLQARLNARPDERHLATVRTSLVRTLRAQGVAGPDNIIGPLLSAMERAGAFRLGATIVGTIAFRLYEGELGVRIRSTDISQTGDIDIAQFERLSLALGDRVEENLPAAFKELAFDPVPSLKGLSVWKWRQTRSNTLIEFLTPSFRDEEDIRELPALGVSAQSLHFLDYLIARPTKAAALYRSGVLVQIPAPERFAIHKLIIADRRKGPDRLKAEKDRLQAAFLIRVLAEDRPDELREAFEDAMGRGPQWQVHIAASLKRLPDTAELLASL